MKYYDIKKKWKSIRPFAESDEATSIWYYHFERYARKQKWSSKPLSPTLTPSDYDNCSWRFGHHEDPRRGRRPHFWQYACHGSCHFNVYLNLYLAECIEPDRMWVVVSSDDHSTVWDGDDTIFDLNFSAIGVPIEECWELAAKQKSSRIVLDMDKFEKKGTQ